MQVREVPVPLLQVEAVADEELVGDRETDVVDGQVVDEAAVGPVEQHCYPQARRVAERQQLAEVVERQAGVDDVLDEQDVEAGERDRRVLEQPHPRVAAGRGVAVAGQLDEVDLVRDWDRPGKVGEEDEARLQQRDEQQVAVGVVLRDLRGGEVDLADALVGRLVARLD